MTISDAMADAILSGQSAPGESFARWNLPPVDGPAVKGRGAKRTVSELEHIERTARAEAHAAGYEAGLAQARAESERMLQQLRDQVTRLDGMLNCLVKPIEQLDAEVEQQLLTLALTVAKQLVRRELRIDPTQVIAVIRETVQLLPASARDVRVHLHPEDAAIVRERLSAPVTERAWTIVEDPVSGRGGCRVTTDTAHIDARLEARIARAVSAVLGDERSERRE